MNRNRRIEVIQETLAACASGGYTAPSGRRVELDTEDIARQAARSRLWRQEELPPRPTTERLVDGRLDVWQGDCLVRALQLQKQRLNVCCLNMASHRKPGGGYLSGAGAQEENLFRRTNYAQYLASDSPYRRPQITYPLPEFGGVYSPNVYVLRGTEEDNYPFLEELERMSFIAVAAYSRPPVTTTPGGELRLRDDYARNTKRKIQLIFQIGLAHRHDAIVLSAFGCGAFQNPPAYMAKLFHQVIEERRYRRAFQHISFAIINDHNAYRRSSPEGNYDPFRRRFGEE